ncbi:ProQ/FinO family protein [Zooshikella ganghwensis]|uniref:ProQ/FinO domain-containing protein n=1 Tax=Zooshikella ganghwensis TaxID=202772 RepID=A0A4P9VGN4_9GAMM|nr:ProQ/FinO family protein [Zooshikella ganghwensis]RDH41586.1 hypothetical protein B9G39_27960 [Zooshikella ganghwensis]
MQKTMAKKPTVTVKKRRRVVVPPPIEVDTPPAAEVAKTELKIKKADPVSYKSRKTAKQILAILADEFPAVFAAEPKPLKSGFTQDYSSTRLTPREWKRGVAAWVTSEKYLKSCTTGTARIDINGQVSGEVTPKEAKYAKAQLAVTQLLKKKQFSGLKKNKQLAMREMAKKVAREAG